MTQTQMNAEVKIRGIDTIASVDISVRGGDDEEVLATLQTLREAVENAEADLNMEGLSDGGG